jgi:hypothetical protein
MARLFRFTVAALAALGLSSPASAAEIIGHIGFAGSIVYDTRGAGTGLAIIDFGDIDGNTGGVSGTGVVFKVGGTTGYFTNISNGSTATILDITNDATADPPATFAPAGFPLLVEGFLSAFTDVDAAGLRFDLTEVIVASGTPCTGTEGLGDTCALGPFTLVETAGGVRVNFDVLGYFRKGAAGCTGGACIDEGFFQGAFATTFGGLTFAELFERIEVSGLDLMCGVDNLETSCTLDANFDSVVPEPVTLVTLGTGLALAGLRRRQNQKRNRK